MNNSRIAEIPSITGLDTKTAGTSNPHPALVREVVKFNQLSNWLEQRINEIEQSAKAAGSS